MLFRFFHIQSYFQGMPIICAVWWLPVSTMRCDNHVGWGWKLRECFIAWNDVKNIYPKESTSTTLLRSIIIFYTIDIIPRNIFRYFSQSYWLWKLYENIVDVDWHWKICKSIIHGSFTCRGWLPRTHILDTWKGPRVTFALPSRTCKHSFL